MIEIQLSKGKVTFIDDIDADLANLKWWAAVKKNGYSTAIRREPGKSDVIHMHRVILSRVLGRSLTKDEIADHIDRNPLNNQRSNLRLVNGYQNSQNRSLNKNNKSGYRGVHLSPEGFWVASIHHNTEQVYLGTFETALDAGVAYNHAAAEFYGNFAVFNDIPDWRNMPISRRTIPITNTSGFKGVYFDKRISKWMALVNKKRIGSFSTPAQANEARQRYIEEFGS